MKDLSKVPTFRLERNSNPRPSGRKASTLPKRYHVQQTCCAFRYPALLVGYLNLTIYMYLPMCVMFSIFSPFPFKLRFEFRVAVLVWYSLIGWAHAYLTHLCSPSLSARSTRHLRSAEQGLLHVPFARTSAMQSRAFSVVDPLVWNGLPLDLRSLPRVFSQKFLQQLKTASFGRAGVGSASE